MTHSRKLNVLLESVKKLIRRKDFKHVANILRKIHSADIAYVLHSLMDVERTRLVDMLCEMDLELAAESVSEMGVLKGVQTLSSLSLVKRVKILQEMDSDDAAELLAAMPEEDSRQILDLMSSAESSSVRDLLKYEEETAGRIMNTDFLTLREEQTVGEAIQVIQSRQDTSVFFYIYVVDPQDRLVGVMSLKHFLLHAPGLPLKKFMRTNVISVNTETDQEEVARQVAKYNLLAIPVVDGANRIVGVVTVDDIIDVIKAEATEDIFYLAGVDADDHTYSPAFSSIRKRIPWLGIYLGIGLVTAWVVSAFQGTIGAYVILAFFFPVVGGMAGNAGNQAMTVTVRGLAIGELTSDSIRKYIWKELRVGLFNGVILGVLAGLVSGSLGYVWEKNYYIGLVMAIAICVNITLAAIWGTVIPLLLKWFKIDPALSSPIFVSTLNDIIGFSTFLGLATILFGVFGL